MNADLSAFYFDIRKDALYCDPPSSVRRRGALEAIEHIFRAVTVWLAPILVFTTEEAWTARDAAQRSVHLEQFPDHPARRGATRRWRRLGDDPRAAARSSPARSRSRAPTSRSARRSKPRRASISSNPEHVTALEGVDFAEVCITSDIAIEFGTPMPGRRRFGCPKRRTSASSWSARRASNARARGAISIRRPLRPIFPT